MFPFFLDAGCLGRRYLAISREIRQMKSGRLSKLEEVEAADFEMHLAWQGYEVHSGGMMESGTQKARTGGGEGAWERRRDWRRDMRFAPLYAGNFLEGWRGVRSRAMDLVLEGALGTLRPVLAPAVSAMRCNACRQAWTRV